MSRADKIKKLANAIRPADDENFSSGLPSPPPKNSR